MTGEITTRRQRRLRRVARETVRTIGYNDPELASTRTVAR
jgi:S-adenosylmethionine synthetase